MSDNQTAAGQRQGQGHDAGPWAGHSGQPGGPGSYGPGSYGPPPGYTAPLGYTASPGYGGYPGYGLPPAPEAMPYGTYLPPRSSQGRTLGIIGLTLSIIPSFTIAGIIMCIISLVQSRREKVRNVPAVVGICVGALYLLISIGLLIISLSSHSVQ